MEQSAKPMINFKLRELDEIIPWSRESEQSIHWFGLTDGDLWLTFGDTTVYEYSTEAMNYWGNKATPYNDYFLTRFIEDFTDLFKEISESIPDEFYKITADLKAFHEDTSKWLAIYDTDEENLPDFYFEEYEEIGSWTWERTMDSGHLIGGPLLSFFRNENKIRIVWQTNRFLDNGVPIWTAKDGSIEMNYSEFVDQIKLFGSSFFSEMGKQVELAVAKDWGEVKIDKQGLIAEHEQRKNIFYAALALLEQEPVEKTDWLKTTQLLQRMKSEIGN